MCVQDIDVQCVLQFTLIHAAGCALHRHTSRVIHRLELYQMLFVLHSIPRYVGVRLPQRPSQTTGSVARGTRRRT